MLEGIWASSGFADLEEPTSLINVREINLRVTADSNRCSSFFLSYVLLSSLPYPQIAGYTSLTKEKMLNN